MMDEEMKKIEFLKSKIATIPDWPKEGIMFRDITTLIQDKEGLKVMTEILVERYKEMKIDAVAGVEARGFIMGSIIAERLNIGFIPIRKAGKLPPETISEEYEKEYGKDKLEIKKGAVEKGSKILLVDDLLATGGTVLAACNLLEKVGGEIMECSFIIDLPDIGGREIVEQKGYKVFNLIEFEGD
jgi:adenine phosphoribosyltransferase